MATDYSILEGELTDLKQTLKRNLHMNQVRRLRKKQDNLALSVIQRKQIENLTKQVAELEPTVTTLYCPQFALRDNEIRGYLVYLLKMKDFYTREVATKQEMINQKNEQIKVMLRKLCFIVNEKAKLSKKSLTKSPEFVQLENMSNRMNQMNKRICTMRQENKEIMENIMNMRKFQKQFKTFEKGFRRKINYLTVKAQEHLDKAVAAYEEKDEFMVKERVFEERCAQDKRKTAINVNALNLYLEKFEKNEAFSKLQDIVRTDTRIAETSDMIEKGVTGLEPLLEKSLDLQSALSAAAGEGTPKEIEATFKFTDDKTDSMFSYLDEILKDIHHMEGEISALKEENKNLIKGMSSCDRRLRRDIKMNKDNAKEKFEEAENASLRMDESKSILNTALKSVKYLYCKICPDDVTSLENHQIDDSNVMDYLQNMEKQLLDYLILIEYIRMKEAEKEEKPLVLEKEDDEDEGDELDKLDDLDRVRPRTLQSECDLRSLMELESERSFLEFDDLKEKALAAITEVQSENSGEDSEVGISPEKNVMP